MSKIRPKNIIRNLHIFVNFLSLRVFPRHTEKGEFVQKKTDSFWLSNKKNGQKWT